MLIQRNEDIKYYCVKWKLIWGSLKDQPRFRFMTSNWKVMRFTCLKWLRLFCFALTGPRVCTMRKTWVKLKKAWAFTLHWPTTACPFRWPAFGRKRRKRSAATSMPWNIWRWWKRLSRCKSITEASSIPVPPAHLTSIYLLWSMAMAILMPRLRKAKLNLRIMWHHPTIILLKKRNSWARAISIRRRWPIMRIKSRTKSGR